MANISIHMRGKAPLTGFLLSALILLVPGIAGAITIDEVSNALDEAKQLRADEFAPGHFQAAVDALEKAKQLLASKAPRSEVIDALQEADAEAAKAADTAQVFSQEFAEMIASYDRMQLNGADKIRPDLARKAEARFSEVVRLVEQGNQWKARRAANSAMKVIHDAELVAARVRILNPMKKAIRDAKSSSGKRYAPKAYNNAVKALRDAEHLVKSNPGELSKAMNLSKHGIEEAKRAQYIGQIGEGIDDRPARMEQRIEAEENRLAELGKMLDVQLPRAGTVEEKFSMVKQAQEDKLNSYRGQLSDSEKQIAELNQRLSKYESQLSDLGEVRRKLQIRRDAEAKIKRLTSLFDPQQVEILLTPESDVILRMKKLNFRSGSAVIPPDAYALLDQVIQSITIFPDRKVRIEGHTDFIGSDKFNQKLSERRAQAVKEYLDERMQGGKKVSAVGYGETRPIANNETAAGRAQNRRIDIVLIAPQP